jgi:hypothetical protein
LAWWTTTIVIGSAACCASVTISCGIEATVEPGKSVRSCRAAIRAFGCAASK